VNLDRKLMAYAAGAVAAGLVGVESADAAIVADTAARPFGVGSTVDLNFDGTGSVEFSVGHERANGNNQTDRVILKAPGNGTNGQMYVVGDNGHPAALPAGTLIGPDLSYDAAFNNNVGNHLVDEDIDPEDNVRDETVFGNFTADSIAGNQQYLGVQFAFEPGGDIHYGWIGVDITNADDLTGVVTGFGYDDVAGTPIEAGAVPEPSAGLALLAVGAAGLLRRKRS
jgi:hypothetical protein